MLMALCALLVSAGATGAQAAAAPVRPAANPWAPVQFLNGEWSGESDGQPGKGSARRSYRFVLGGKFLEEQNVSTYPPQPRNEKGEVHEHRSLFSYDRARQALVLRQFHQEGFVNQYVMLPPSPGGRVVFESEALENVPASWKAREAYEVVSADEFVETFELSQGGKPFEVYSRARFKRVPHAPTNLESLRFLLGDWQAQGGGKPGEAQGGFTFAPGLQGRVIVRTNYADYPATGGKPASRHEDLMVLYAIGSGELRADYYDSEAHVIRYAGSQPSANELVLTSEIVSGTPRFRLSYKLGADGTLDGRFEMAPPGKPDAFGPYLTWTARRRDAGK